MARFKTIIILSIVFLMFLCLNSLVSATNYTGYQMFDYLNGTTGDVKACAYCGTTDWANYTNSVPCTYTSSGYAQCTATASVAGLLGQPKPISTDQVMTCAFDVNISTLNSGQRVYIMSGGIIKVSGGARLSDSYQYKTSAVWTNLMTISTYRWYRVLMTYNNSGTTNYFNIRIIDVANTTANATASTLIDRVPDSDGDFGNLSLESQVGSESHYYRNVSCWNGTFDNEPIAESAAADVGAPIISNINFTSCGSGDTSEPFNDNCGDTTPTYTFDTNEAATCKISTTNHSKAYDNFNLSCTTTGSTSHVCTVNSTYALSEGNSSVYAACVDGTGNNNSILSANNEFFTVLIMDYPTVTLSYPTNAINITNTTIIQFNASAWDGSNIKSLSLWSNWSGSWSKNESNSSAVFNNTVHTITSFTLPTGNYKWNVNACDPYQNCNFSATNFTFTVIGGIKVFLNSNISELIYNPNWTLAIFNATQNGTDWFDTGNYTFTLTEYNISTMNVTSFLFNASNANTISMDVNLKQNGTLSWMNWLCDGVNITSTATKVFTLAANTSKIFNCTLSLINISQTYTNFTLGSNRAYWGFTYTFS